MDLDKIEEFGENYSWKNTALVIRDATFFSASLHLTYVFLVMILTGKSFTIMEPNQVILFLEFWIMLTALFASIHLAWEDVRKQ